MMKRFSTRADKWFYVFALISHIFNFFAKSSILFLYYIDDHQENHFFFVDYRSNQFSNHFFFLFVHFYHFFSLFFSVYFHHFSFFFLFLIFFLSIFVNRLSFVFRCLSRSVRYSKNQKKNFFFFFLLFFLFFFFFRCFELLRQSTTFMTCLKTSIFAKM